MGKNGNNDKLYFFGSKITEDGDCSMKLRDACFFNKLKTKQHKTNKQKEMKLSS